MLSGATYKELLVVEENGEAKEDKFEFDYAGEARGYISLDPRPAS